MTTLAAIRPDDALKRYFYISLIIHMTFCVLGGMYSYFYARSADWGGPGGSITVGIVGSLPAIPLPRPEVVSENRVVDESKGLYKTEPAAPPKPPVDATPIPKFERNKPPKYVTRPSKVLENSTPPPTNAIPYGGGGTPTVPTTSFALGGGTTQAGLSFSGTNGGDFGSRFSWYVEAVQRRVSSNWLQSTVDPSVATAPRSIVTFTILRNGTVTNIQVTHSSNNYSVDGSGIRAVRDSSPLAPLPPEYSGSNVNVEFWFDFHR
jgi:periplasmic protein TonB